MSVEPQKNELRGKGKQVSRSKAEYLKVRSDEEGPELKLKGETVKKVEKSKYLGSVVSWDGSCEEEAGRKIQSG